MGIHPTGGGQHGLLGFQSKLPELRGDTGLGDAREERADSRDALEHQGVVHVLVRAGGVRPHEAGLQRSVQFQAKSPFRQIGQQVRTGRCRSGCRRLGIAPGIQRGTDPGSADRSFGIAQARNLHDPDAKRRKEFLHQAIVAGGQRIGRFAAHEAHGRTEGRCDMPAEKVDVQPHLRLGYIGKVL